MREYLAWKEAHSGRKSSAEKHAGIQLDEDDVDDEDDLSGDNEERDTDETGVAKGGEEEAREKRGYSSGENDGEQEWAVEEEEVAARIEHRRVSMICDMSLYYFFSGTTYLLQRFILRRIFYDCKERKGNTVTF